MFLITCPGCEHPHLAAPSDILSLHDTSEGVVGYVRCHDTGEILVHNFTIAETLGLARVADSPVTAGATAA